MASNYAVKFQNGITVEDRTGRIIGVGDLTQNDAVLKAAGVSAADVNGNAPRMNNDLPSAAPPNSRYTAPASGTYDSEMAAYLKKASAPVDEQAIRDQKRKDAQDQIDAINTRFDSAITEDKRLGVGYMGQTRSAGARAGLSGSDFGNAQLDTTTKNNADVIKADEASRAMEMSKIFANVDQRAQDEINSKTEMALKGQENYISWLKSNQDSARTDFAAIAKTGGIKSLTELSTEDYKKLLDQTGYDEGTAKLIFNANLPAAKQIEYQFKVDANKLVAYGVDPATGKVDVIEKTLEDNVPPNYKPTVLPDGTLIFSPDKIDASKPLKDQVIMFGAEGQFAKPVAAKSSGGGGGTIKPQTAQEKVQAYFSGLVGADYKVSPETWGTAKAAWIQDGNNATDFDNKFKGYKDPNNEYYQ